MFTSPRMEETECDRQPLEPEALFELMLRASKTWVELKPIWLGCQTIRNHQTRDPVVVEFLTCTS